MWLKKLIHAWIARYKLKRYGMNKRALEAHTEQLYNSVLASSVFQWDQYIEQIQNQMKLLETVDPKLLEETRGDLVRLIALAEATREFVTRCRQITGEQSG